MLRRVALLLGWFLAVPVWGQTSVPTPVLRIELADTPPQIALDSTRLFTFIIRNLESDSDFVYTPRYRLSGTTPSFEGETRDVLHANFLSSDTVTYQLRAVALGRVTLTLRVDYVECSDAALSCVPKSTTQLFALEIVAGAGATATSTPLGTRSGTVSAVTPSPTTTPVVGLTYDLLVVPSNPVVGDTVSFIFTISNRQAGIVARRPMYRLSGLAPNFEGDMSTITHDVDISGAQTDTVQFNFRAAKDGVTQLQMQVNYLECRGAQCGGGFSQSMILPVVTRGSPLTPLPTSAATGIATATITPTPTPSPPTPTSTAPMTATATASPLPTPIVEIAISVEPPQPAVGQDVTVMFTIRNPQGPATLRRQGYVLSGTTPNFEGNIEPIEHDVAILGTQTDSVTYRLRSVNEGTSLLQLHMTYEACAQSQPCPFGFTSSPIFPVSIAGVAPTRTPGSLTPGASTPTATASFVATPQPTPVLTYELTVDPQKLLVGDEATLVFTVRNVQSATQAVRPNYHVSGSTPNFESPIPAQTHDVVLSGEVFDVVVYRLATLQAGTSLLQLHATYDVCTAEGQPCSFGNSSSPIFRVAIEEQPTPTPTRTPTATPSFTITPSPTITASPTVDGRGTLTVTPTPTPTIGITGSFSDGDCSVRGVGRRYDGVVPLLAAAIGLLVRRGRRP